MYECFLSYKSIRYKGGVILSNDFERIMKEQVGEPLRKMNESFDKTFKAPSAPPPKKKTLSGYSPLMFYAGFGLVIIYTIYRMGLYTLYIPLP